MGETPEHAFAAQLREQRRASGLTQAELARRVSKYLPAPMGSTVITKIESGSRPVRLDEAVYMAIVLEVPLAALVVDRDPREVALDELRQELARRQSRAAEAEYEYRQANQAVIDVECQIDRFEQLRES